MFDRLKSDWYFEPKFGLNAHKTALPVSFKEHFGSAAVTVVQLQTFAFFNGRKRSLFEGRTLDQYLN